MCGIYYFLSKKSEKEQLKKNINYIIEKIKYRGPDYTNIVYDNNNIFIHTLLAIQGFNPQPYKDNNNYLLFNGEIYGTSSLEKSKLNNNIKYLEIPSCFKNEGVFLLDFFKKYNFSKLDNLDGEFVINYIDNQNSKLHIITDPFGTKPLCFYNNNDYFIASSYESCVRKTMKILNLNGNIEFVIPNTHYIYDLTTFKLKEKKEIIQWDFNPRYSNFDRWNIAFNNSIKKRTNTTKGIFIPLSSGYDSGCIVSSMLTLKKKFKTYTFKGVENMVILEKRKKLIENNYNEFYYIKPVINLKEKYNEYFKRIENYTGYHYNGIPYSDIYEAWSCFGIFQIFQKARTDNQIIFLSGHGGDEIFSDYGNIGNRGASILELDYTNVRSKWPNFDSSYGRNIIQMFERVAGCFGIESRYPFLDKQVVQEFLWLSDHIKNSNFKQCIGQYMDKCKFPYLKNEKCRVRIIQDKDGGRERFTDHARKVKLINNYVKPIYPIYNYKTFKKQPYRPNLNFKPCINYYPLYHHYNKESIYPTNWWNYTFREANYFCIHSYQIIIKGKVLLPINILITSNENIEYYLLIYNKINKKNLLIKINNNRIILNNYDKNNNYIILTIKKNNLFYFGSNKTDIYFDSLDKKNKFKLEKLCKIPLTSISYLQKIKKFYIPDEYPETLYYINNVLKKGCDILFLSYKDWCNTCRRYMKSMEHVGLKTIGLKSVKHVFNYPDEMKISKV